MLFQRVSHKKIADLEAELERSNGQIRELKTAIRLLRNEWEDTYTKLRKLWDRTRKAQMAIEKEAENAPQEPTGDQARVHAGATGLDVERAFYGQ